MKRLLIFLTALLFAGSLFAQTNDDHSREELVQLADSLDNAAMESYNSSDYDKAIELGTKAMEIRRDVLGERDPDYASSLHNLAKYNSALGNYDKALELVSKAAQIRKDVLGTHNPDYAASIQNLALYYYHLGNYDKAIEVGTEAVEIRKGLDNRDQFYAGTLNNLANFYSHVGNYDKAIEYENQAVEVYKDIFGEQGSGYGLLLDDLAEYNASIGDYGNAVELETQAAEVYKEAYGDRDSHYATALNKLADYYRIIGDYSKAVEFGTEATDIRREVLGEEDPDYAGALHNLAIYNYYLGDIDRAIELGTEAMELQRKISGELDPDYARSLSTLAVYHHAAGNYDKAVEFGTEAVEIDRGVLGDRDPYYALELDRLAVYYDAAGNYEAAVKVGTELAEINKDVLGDQSPDYARSLSAVADAYSNLGDYGKAIELETEAAEINKEVLGDRSSDYAISLGNLARYYKELADYGKEIELTMEAMEIFRDIGHPDYVTSLGQLADIYRHLGNYDKAIELCNEAVEAISLEANGNVDAEYAYTLGVLALCYSDIGNYEKAMELETKAMEIHRDIDEDDYSYAQSLNNMAGYYEDVGNYKKAIELYTEALEIVKDVLGVRNVHYAYSLGNLSSCYSDIGDYEKALELAIESTELIRDIRGDRHLDYAYSLNILSVGYYYLGDYEKAVENLTLSQKIKVEHLRNNFSFLTAGERSLYWDSVSDKFVIPATFCLIYPSAESFGLAYDVALLSKGILLSSEREFDKVIKESGDEELLAKFEQLRQDRLQLEVYYKQSVDERPADEVAKLEAEADQLEKDLIAGSKEYGDFTRSLAIEWADVRDALGDKDVAIEFTKMNLDPDQYVAMVLRKGWNTPRCAYIGTAEEFEPYFKMNYNDLYKSREFSEKVWAGIVEAADLQEGDNVYFSPDGIFYQLGIEYLPVVGEEVSDGVAQSVGADGTNSDTNGSVNTVGARDRIMADKYNLRRLSSTKELCFEPSATAENSAVLYGGLIYEINTEASEETSEDKFSSVAETSSSEGASGVEVAMVAGGSEAAVGIGFEATKRDMTVGRLLAERGERGAEADSLMRDNIKYLPGTLVEADTLATMLADRDIAYEKYTGYKGTEETFKALTGNAPKLIHIATHGFYLSPTSAEIMSQQRHSDFLSLGEDRQNNVIDYSMSRSGLLFAGAQSAWFGEPVPAGEDDGILTAQEIAGLDLRGVDLAVLSACSTANGEVTGDGVAGLQRGFKKAGVKTLLLTLWEVNDRATQLFMTNFYENLTAGKTKRQAFDAAQSYLRDYEDWIELEIDDPDGEPVYDDTIGDWVRPTKVIREWGKPYANPQFWAAFIMLD